jgi:hypothetical protein
MGITYDPILGAFRKTTPSENAVQAATTAVAAKNAAVDAKDEALQALAAVGAVVLASPPTTSTVGSVGQLAVWHDAEATDQSKADHEYHLLYIVESAGGKEYIWRENVTENQGNVAGGYPVLGVDGKVASEQLPPMDYIPDSEKGVSVATLGSNGKVPASQLPSLDYVPEDAVGRPGGVAALGQDGKVPGSQLPTDAIPTDLSDLSDATGILAGKVDKDGDKVLSDNNYTDAEKAKVGKIELETLTELTGANVTIAPWTQSKWSASGTCTLTASGWAESGHQVAYIVITLAAGSTPSVVGTEAVEDGDALSAAGVYECYIKNVDGKKYFRVVSFTEAAS